MTKVLPVFLLLFLLVACGQKEKQATTPVEDVAAKKMLQGIWLDEENGEPAFRVEGDTIFYPDSTSAPVHFYIIQDTLVLEGSRTLRYAVVKKSNNIFQFVNQNGEQVKLVKSVDKADNEVFEIEHPIALNQRQTIKRDTIVGSGNDRYHCYVQVNPTTYKVYKQTYNDDGMQVDNIYYDNSIHVAIFRGNARVYTHDFHKQDFSKLVPKDFINQCILSDMLLKSSNEEGVHYEAQLAIPDTPSIYLVDVAISYKGAMRMNITE